MTCSCFVISLSLSEGHALPPIVYIKFQTIDVLLEVLLIIINIVCSYSLLVVACDITHHIPALPPSNRVMNGNVDFWVKVFLNF